MFCRFGIAGGLKKRPSGRFLCSFPRERITTDEKKQRTASEEQKYLGREKNPGDSWKNVFRFRLPGKLAGGKHVCLKIVFRALGAQLCDFVFRS